ncbi:PEP-CTERM sorting domain-containing protein [Merismopedia glauca]|uniref:PEP-CTERM sorting domain-containing protein n=1 Tax=Merismopedia glauca CCAP 1448/3 TaxID=1296344 RepID=A0A2T1C5H9_9CYAN|nr:PEP-CTERM sorting domain-containing protein [Merismopedia glauca]PSB03397.1 PEP-CTERM sorting domain-containing protein [Merismopedia glauca CCAP 1448/3]
MKLGKVIASVVGGSTAFILASALTATGTKAATVVLDFEGVGDLNPVGNFYDTAPHDFDITFSDNALGIVDEDAGGSGNFGGEPSRDTVLFFLGGSAARMNVLNGFTTGFSFFYSAINNPGFVRVLDASDNVLAQIDLPTTPFNGAPDPTGQFSPFVPIGVTFQGTAFAVDFGGTVNQIGFDNITLGSATPGTTVPEPTTILGTLAFSALGGSTWLKRRRKQQG